MNPRVTAAHILTAVSHKGLHLDDAFDKYLSKVNNNQHAFIKALCFGTLREYPRLQFILDLLIEKPLKQKEGLLQNLILGGLYECQKMHTPEHACVSETVQATVKLKRQWAKGLINAVLRKFLRETDRINTEIEKTETARFAHPQWLIDKIKSDWPDHYELILSANNQQGPLSLRVNQQKVSREKYLQILADNHLRAQAISQTKHGIDCEQVKEITDLPGYREGLFSVQDAAAQLAAELLAPLPGEHILDACAAPGGKTTHLLETEPDLELVALDISENRLARIRQNLQRLKQNAVVLRGNAAQANDWWDGRMFDRILLDAPCSATGVIRRHPDIKLLRQPEDIAQLTKIQQEILSALWPLLKAGGMLLYGTCSILLEENEQQIQQFIANHPDAQLRPIAADWGLATLHGRQILPGQVGMDGFFYSLIHKCEKPD